MGQHFAQVEIGRIGDCQPNNEADDQEQSAGRAEKTLVVLFHDLGRPALIGIDDPRSFKF